MSLFNYQNKIRTLLPRSLAVALLFTALSTICGCAHIVKSLGLMPEAPSISFQDAAIKSASFSLVETEITIAVKNLDQRPLELWGLNFDLFVEDEAVGTGALPSKLNLAAGELQTVIVPIGIKPSNALGSLLKLMETRRIPNASIRGDLTFATWLGPIKIGDTHLIGY